MEVLFNPITYLVLAILIYSAILHEIAHGVVADRLGDPTARLLGRITLDPRPHIDPWLTIAMPAMLFILSQGSFIFGGAKPVPVDPFNLKDGLKDLALVSLAGPGTNIVIAIVASILFLLVPGELNLQQTVFAILSGLYPLASLVDFVAILLAITAYLNILLALFNLLPIPPLDGSKVFAMLLPEKAAQAYLSLGSMGMLILFVLVFFPIGPFSISRLISIIISSLLGVLSF